MIDYLKMYTILIKVIFLVVSVGHILLTLLPNETIDAKLIYWRERTEFIFIICVSLLLIYYFHDYGNKHQIDEETAMIFFMGGLTLLITAKWKHFIKTSPWTEHLRN